MYPPPFAYARAGSLEDALQALAEHGDEARLLAGGQSLLPFMKLFQVGPTVLVDISRLEGLDGVHDEGAGLRLGPLTRHAQIARAEWPARLAILSDAARVIADVQVRNRGTVGGSLAYADPAGDWAPALIALGASVLLRSDRSERSVPLDEFFTDEHETVIEPNEMITEIRARPVSVAATGAYFKLARRHGDYAVASVGVQIDWAEDGRIERAGIGLGGTGTTPVKATAAEAFLNGKTIDSFVLETASDLVMDAVDPISDFRGSAEYRTAMVGELFARALNGTLRRSQGESVAAGYV